MTTDAREQCKWLANLQASETKGSERLESSCMLSKMTNREQDSKLRHFQASMIMPVAENAGDWINETGGMMDVGNRRVR